MSDYEQLMCRCCGSTYQGRQIVRLKKSNLEQWGDIQHKIDDLISRQSDVVTLSALCSPEVVVPIGFLLGLVLFFSHAPHSVQWWPFIMAMLLVVGLGVAEMRWGMPWLLARYSTTTLEKQQEQILTVAGYDPVELKSHGYVVEERK